MCHHCSILPTRILEKLEKETNARLFTKDLSDKLRKKRAAALLRTDRYEGFSAGTADRWVFDSQHSEEQRVKLVRGEGQLAINDREVNSVYDHAGIIRRYFLEDLGWNSLDNSGMDLLFNVHLSVQYNNAFWDGDDVSYGDGDGTYFKGFAHAIDVTAHEMSHGIVQYTAGLLYEGQPGALNEHFADVFGTVIKQLYKGQNEQTADWLLGDEIMGPALAGRAIRSMKTPDDPHIPLDPQPAHMKDYFHGEEDYYGVHINSGIPNKAFYLVALHTGTFAAGKLWFEALKKLRNTSRFSDLHRTLAECIPALVRGGILNESAGKILDQAFADVGIISIPSEALARP